MDCQVLSFSGWISKYCGGVGSAIFVSGHSATSPGQGLLIVGASRRMQSHWHSQYGSWGFWSVGLCPVPTRLKPYNGARFPMTFPSGKIKSTTVSRRVARFSSCESRSIKTGTCLRLSQGLAQKRNFNTKSKQEKYQRKFKSRSDHGKFHAKWPRTPPLSQLENLATLWETVYSLTYQVILG